MKRMYWSYIILSFALLLAGVKTSYAITDSDFVNLCVNAKGNSNFNLAHILEENPHLNVNYQNSRGMTPLMAIAANKNLDEFLSINDERAYILQSFIKRGADPNLQDVSGNTALMLALATDPKPSVVWSLMSKNTDLGLKNRHGQTALDLAATMVSDPEVLAVLIGGAKMLGNTSLPDKETFVRLAETAKSSKNRKIHALFDNVASNCSQLKTKWHPLFLALPARTDLQDEIRQTVQKVLAFANKRENPRDEIYKYLLWQAHLADILQTFKSFGHDADGAWHEVYLQYSEALSIRGRWGRAFSVENVATRLVAQGDYKDIYARWDPIYVAQNDILVSKSDIGFTGYELSSGRELWNNAAPCDKHVIYHNLLLASIYYVDDNFGTMDVIDTNNGKTIARIMNPQFWMVDQEQKKLVIVAYEDIYLFDLSIYLQNNWIKIHTKKFGDIHEGMYEDEHIKRAIQREKYISDYIKKFGFELKNFFAINNNKTFDYNVLKKGLAGSLEVIYKVPGEDSVKFEISNSKKLDTAKALAIDSDGFNQFSLWHGGPQKQLVIFDRLQETLAFLHLPSDTGNQIPLTYDNLAFHEKGDDESTDDSANKAIAAFGLKGSLLGVGEKNGNLQFFASNGNFIGTANAGTSVRMAKNKLTIGDLKLVSILDASDPKTPLLKCRVAKKPDEIVMVRVNLSENSAYLVSRPSDPEIVGVSAFAMNKANTAAVACEDGTIWFINLENGKLRQSKLKNKSPWGIMRFSDNGNFLALADKEGRIAVMDQNEKIFWSMDSGINKGEENYQPIKQILVDNAGQRVWIHAGDLFNLNLTLFTPKDKPKKIDPKYQKGWSATGLHFNTKLDMATILLSEEDRGEAGHRPEHKWPLESVVDNTAQIETRITYASGHDMTNDGVHLRRIYEYESGATYCPNYIFDLSRNKFCALNNDEALNTGRGPSCFSGDNQLIALGGNNFSVHDMQSGNILRKMLDSNKHPRGIDHISFLNNKPNYLITAGADGTVRLWDLKPTDPVNILTWAFFKNGNHVVTGADYRFDSADLDKLEGVHWVMDSRPGKTAALASLMKAYYQPRLAEYVLANKKLPELPDIEKLNLAQHGVRLVGIEPEKEAPGKVAVTVEVYVRGKDENHPAQELKLFRDGQLVGKYTGENNGLFDLPDGKRQVTFRNIALPQGKNQVMFKGWAFNNDGVRSKYFDKPYSYKPTQTAKPQVHLLSVGVNSFDNPAWNLNLAASDAKGYAEILPPKLPGVTTNVRLMTSEEGQNTQIKPTKAGLKAALQDLAGKSSPDDVVLVTIASHGMTDDKTNQFYIMPSDIPGSEKKVTPELLSHSISSDELSEWLTGVDAGEFIMILDTCQSGAALGGESFKPGPMGDRGLGQIAYDKAMRVLTATNENNAAMEVGDLGHGLLSYALLVDGLEKGRVKKDKSGSFTFGEWLGYGKKRTAELYADIASGKNPARTRGRVKVNKSKDNANPPLGQEPYLFDFAQQKDGKVMIQVK